MVYAYGTADGKAVWQFDTNRDFQTVNGAKADGGGVNAAGPVVAGGMLFVSSGYSDSGAAAIPATCSWRSPSSAELTALNRPPYAPRRTLAAVEVDVAGDARAVAARTPHVGGDAPPRLGAVVVVEVEVQQVDVPRRLDRRLST